MKRSPPASRSGFPPIEILVVIVVIAILPPRVAPQVFLPAGSAPGGDPRPTNWRGPYLRKEVPLDPWDHAYIYKAPGVVNPTGYDLLSYGADGAAGGDGENADITSWSNR